MANGARLHALCLRGHAPWRALSHPGATADPDAAAGAAPRPGHLGRQRRGVRPRAFRAGAGARPARPRLQAFRHRAAGLHRPPVRPAGGTARAGHDPAALHPDRSSRLPASPEADADHQAGRVDDPGAASHRAEDRGSGPARGAGATAGRSAAPDRERCRAAARALRLEPGGQQRGWRSRSPTMA